MSVVSFINSYPQYVLGITINKETIDIVSVCVHMLV
jgi:hypothetical protein